MKVQYASSVCFFFNFLFFIVTLEVFVCISFHLIRFDSVWCPNSFKFFFPMEFCMQFLFFWKYWFQNIILSRSYVYGCVSPSLIDKKKLKQSKRKHWLRNNYKKTGNIESAPNIYGNFMWIDKFRFGSGKKKTNVSYALAKNENKYELPTKLKTNGGKDKVKSIESDACIRMFCTNFPLAAKWYWCRFQWGCITKAALYNALYLFLPFLLPSSMHLGPENFFLCVCVALYD